MEEEISIVRLQGSDYLKCCFCKHHFSEDTQPRLLHCLHGVCDACLRRYSLDNTISCQFCGRQQSPNENSDFPFDYSRLAWIKLLSMKNCSFQTDCDKLAEYSCKDCSAVLCGDCYDLHKKVRTLTGHNVIKIADLSTIEERLRNLTHIEKCDKQGHEDQPKKYYCAPCKEHACVKCIVSEHTNSGQEARHSYIDITKEVSNRREIMEEHIHATKRKVEKIKAFLQVIESESQNLNHSADRLDRKIDEEFKRRFDIMRRKQEEMKRQLRSLVEDKHDILEQQKKHFKGMISQMEEKIELTNYAAMPSNSLNYQNIQKIHTDTLAKLATESVDAMPNSKAWIDIIEERDSQQFETFLFESLRISSTNVYPPNVSISLPDPPMAGMAFTVNISLLDNLKHKAEENSGDFFIKLQRQGVGEGGQVQETIDQCKLPVKTQTNNEDELSVKLKSPYPGQHSIELYYLHHGIVQTKDVYITVAENFVIKTPFGQ